MSKVTERPISQQKPLSIIEGIEIKGGVNQQPTTPPPPPPKGQGGKKKQSEDIQEIIRGCGH